MSLSHSSKNIIALAAICLSALMFGLEISSVPVILPTLEKVLHGNLKDMQWIMNAYTIASTTVLMAVGTLADRYGRRRIFIISLVLFGITSLICGLAQSTSVLIVSRFLQCVSAGAMLICQIAILSHQFQEGKEHSKAFGAWGIVFGIGLGFGPIIGGMIVAVSNWHWVFLVHVPLTILTLIYTGSVPSTRAGMASGIDTSARLISLAINIAVMGFILQEGILSYLKGALPGTLDATQLRSVAEKIAAGDTSSLKQGLSELSSLDASGAVVHAALVHGFGWVMLYGGIGVWVLAVIGFMVFGPKKALLHK